MQTQQKKLFQRSGAFLFSIAIERMNTVGRYPILVVASKEAHVIPAPGDATAELFHEQNVAVAWMAGRVKLICTKNLGRAAYAAGETNLNLQNDSI